MTHNKIFNRGTSKARNFNLIIIGVIFCLYLFINYCPVFIRNELIFTYFIVPLLWSIVVFIILCFPRPKSKGKIRLMNFQIWMTVLFSSFYLLIMLFCGMVIGFGKSPFDHSLFGTFINLFRIFPALIATELARGYLINNNDQEVGFRYFVLVAMFFTFINIIPDQLNKLETNLDKLKFLGRDILPNLSDGIFAAYLVYIGGPVLSIIYLGIQKSFYWFSPILPNLNWITQAFIGTLFPIFSLMSFRFNYENQAKTARARDKEENPLSWGITIAISILIIWFAVGVFPVRPYVIATGSMEPVIHAGDMVLVQRIDARNLQVGDIIQFKSDQVFIFHRVVEIVKEKREIKYKTKGDNNSSEDAELVKVENIKGRVIYTIPKVGYPTLLFKRLGSDNNKYEF